MGQCNFDDKSIERLQNAITETEDEVVKDEGDEISHREWFMLGGEKRPYAHDPHAAMFPEDMPGDDR